MGTTIDEIIDLEPAEGALGKYRVIDEDVYLGVIRKNVKFIDYVVDAHVTQIAQNIKDNRFYAIFDISKCSVVHS